MSKTLSDTINDWLSYAKGHEASGLIAELAAHGFVIAPKEPTPEMRDAGFVFIGGDITTIEASEAAKDCYLAMLAAKDETHIRDESDRLSGDRQ